jgi:hypothetical protein
MFTKTKTNDFGEIFMKQLNITIFVFKFEFVLKSSTWVAKEVARSLREASPSLT